MPLHCHAPGTALERPAERGTLRMETPREHPAPLPGDGARLPRTEA
ncbi:hypothetical protein [Peterkaempfera sp. SMS 1(5)a]